MATAAKPESTAAKPQSTAAMPESTAAKPASTATEPGPAAGPSEPTDGSYVVPMLHTHVPARAVEWGFWGGLAGAALLGAIDPPLALLVGAGVVVARHRLR